MSNSLPAVLLVLLVPTTLLASECSESPDKVGPRKSISPCTCVQYPVYPIEGDVWMFVADYWNGADGDCGTPEASSLPAPYSTPAGECDGGDCDDASCEGAERKAGGKKTNQNRRVPVRMKSWDNAFRNFFVARRGMNDLQEHHVAFDLPSRRDVHARVARISYDAHNARWPLKHNGRQIPAEVRASWLLAGSQEFWIGVEIDPSMGTPPAPTGAQYVADRDTPAGVVIVRWDDKLIPVHVDE